MSASPPSQSARRFDVAVIGNGIIGLSSVLELARHGTSCALVGASEPGGGSGAAAGILAPSAGRRDMQMRDFFRYSLGLFPGFLASLRESDAELTILEGLLEILAEPDPPAVERDSRRLSAAEVRQTEPALNAPLGALLHSRDGAIDSNRVVSALRTAVTRHPLITLFEVDGARTIDVGESPARITTRGGASIQANTIVLAAGAWSSQIGGIPSPIPVFPVKGQIIALDAPGVLGRPVMGNHTYLVPRGQELVVGATSENVGFDITTTDNAAHDLHAAAIEICPALANARIVRRWAGLRPATPDLLPILGPDPTSPSLIYACGHSRNGILLAPATAEAIRAFVEHRPLPHAGIARLSIARFQSS